jgi:hypothetical protein
MKLTCAIWAALALFSAAVPAAEPRIIQNPGEPIEAVWPSGNRARLLLSKSKPISAPVEFQITENMCTRGTGQIFTVIPGIRVDFTNWVWTEHKDPAKVGQNVSARFPNGKVMDLTLAIFFSSGSRFIDPKLIEGLPDDEIVFDDVSWIPGMEDGVLRPFTLESWNSEQMDRNSQTGAIENRIVAGENGMQFIPDSAKHASIVHGEDGFFTDKLNHGLYMFGDVVSWIFNTGGRTCQIVSKPNVDKARAALNDYLSHMQFNFQPYRENQDAMGDIIVETQREGLANAIE